MENFVLFRQAVYNSYYKFLFCIGVIIALVWVAAYDLARKNVAPCKQKVSELASSEPREHLMGFRSIYGDRWESDMQSAKDDLQNATDGYRTIRYFTALILGILGLLSGICTQYILMPDQKEHELYCKAINLPFLTALCYCVLKKKVNLALW